MNEHWRIWIAGVVWIIAIVFAMAVAEMRGNWRPFIAGFLSGVAFLMTMQAMPVPEKGPDYVNNHHDEHV